MPIKTLRQMLIEEPEPLTIKTIQKVVAEWLLIHQILHIEIAKEWQTDHIDTYTIFTNLIGELQE